MRVSIHRVVVHFVLCLLKGRGASCLPRSKGTNEEEKASVEKGLVKKRTAVRPQGEAKKSLEKKRKKEDES